MIAPRDPIRAAIAALQRNGIGDIARLGLGNPDVVPVWFGETDLVTPDFIREAAVDALNRGRTFYTFAGGLPDLRAEIVRYMARWPGAQIGLERVTVPGSAMLSVILSLQCVLETGDNVVIVTPVWPNIFQAVVACGGEPRFVRLSSGDGRWTLDPGRLEAACDARTKAIFIASPGNPTGWVMSADDQAAVLSFARARGIAIISDEVYGPLVYEGRHAPSFAALATPEDNVFIINSFSKAWAMTGWRIGWLVHPARLSAAITGLSAVNNTGATSFAQYGALAALKSGDPFIAEMVARCGAGRAIVADWINTQSRVRWIPPAGAFYGFLEIDGLSDSFAFARDLVLTHKVGVAPGVAFGPEDDVQNRRHIRICFAQDPQRLTIALERIAQGLARL